MKGVKICILGVVEAEFGGIPSTHPNNAKGMKFSQAEEAIRKYLWLRNECDVFILLSHIGYDEDVEVAKKFPEFDLIIGGHSHTQIDGGEVHNGVLITQNENKLKKLTHTVLVVENGKVTGKSGSKMMCWTFISPPSSEGDARLRVGKRTHPDKTIAIMTSALRIIS